MLTPMAGPQVRIEILSCQADSTGRWRVTWRVTNDGPEPLHLEDAWIPHGRFRGEGHIPLSIEMRPGQSTRLDLRVNVMQALPTRSTAVEEPPPIASGPPPTPSIVVEEPPSIASGPPPTPSTVVEEPPSIASGPPPTVIENAFLILRASGSERAWRIFAKIRVEFDARGAPTPIVEAVTTQSLQ